MNYKNTAQKGWEADAELSSVLDLAKLIKSIDLNKVVEEKKAKLTPIERLAVEAMEPDKKRQRYLHVRTCNKRCGEVCKREHAKTQKARKLRARAKARDYVRNVGRPKQRLREARAWLCPKESYKQVMHSLNTHASKKVKSLNYPYAEHPNTAQVRISYEEWEEVIYPSFSIRGNVPVFRRYDTKKPYTVENLIVLDSTTKGVLFDGQEYVMRKAGYIF